MGAKAPIPPPETVLMIPKIVPEIFVNFFCRHIASKYCVIFVTQKSDLERTLGKIGVTAFILVSITINTFELYHVLGVQRKIRACKVWRQIHPAGKMAGRHGAIHSHP